MKIVNQVLPYLLVLCLSATQTMACNPPAENEDKNKYSFSFEFIEEGLVFKKSINGEPKRELLDDTGFLGIQVGLSAVMDGIEENIRLTRYNQQINFTKERIDTYLALIRPITTPNASQMADKEKVIQNLTKIKELLTSDPPVNEIHDLWKEVEAANARFVTVSAKSRSAGGSTWGPEQVLSAYTLPSPKRFDPTRPRMRCISLPYAGLDLDSYNPPRRPSSRAADGGSSGSAGGVD